MKRKIEIIAAAAGREPAVARKLDQLLDHPDDRAFVICEHMDCLHNREGKCTIYAIRPAAGEGPCAKYRRRN